MPDITIRPNHRPIDAAAEHREQRAVIAMLGRDAIAIVRHDAIGAHLIALVASEMRAEMARDGAP